MILVMVIKIENAYVCREVMSKILPRVSDKELCCSLIQLLVDRLGIYYYSFKFADVVDRELENDMKFRRDPKDVFRIIR